MEVKDVFIVIGIVCLCFFGIPLRLKKPQSEREVLFQTYVNKFNKTYNETEFLHRFENFKVSLKLIEDLNKNRTSEESAWYGLTQFSDLSSNEFKLIHLHKHLRRKQHKQWQLKSKILSSNIQQPNVILNDKSRIKRAIEELPKKVDWREKGVVSAIRNQKTCGACWAFSTVETMESMYAIKTGKLEQLSVQEVIDCAGNGNYGCEGGNTCSLLAWLHASKTKVQPESNYPFEYTTKMCRLKPASTGVQIASNYSCDNFVGNENQFLLKLANHGPVAAAVNAINWQYYLGGVIQFHCAGGEENLNHAVQIIGYDQTSLIPHYIVRNSWGIEFGNEGYLYIAIGDNVCGVADEVSSLDIM